MFKQQSETDSITQFRWSESLLASPSILTREVQQQGFAVVRGLFSKDEIEKMRATVRNHLTHSGSRFSLGKTQPNAAVVLPDLGWIFSHPRVVALFKSLIGTENPVFTGHCDIHMNMLSGWHRDTGEAFGSYFTGDYLRDDACRVFKMAIYLQDTTPRDGLTVIPAAHRSDDYDVGKALNLRTRVGDVVLFDVRLPHTGQLPDYVEKAIKALNVILKGKNRTTEDASLATALKRAYCELIGRGDRLSVFFTYGDDNPRTEEFARANMVRQNKQARLNHTALPQSLVESLTRQGVLVSAT